MSFAANMGTADRAIRFAAGALLIVLALAGVIGAWGYVGVVPIATSLLRFCPAYTLLGIKTCKAG
jgi:hypothetical protein